MSHERPASPESANSIERVNSVAELLPALKKEGVLAAMVESPIRTRIVEFVLHTRGRFTENYLNIEGLNSNNSEGIKKVIKARRNKLLTELSGPNVQKSYKDGVLRGFDIVASEVTTILATFPDHLIDFNYLGVNADDKESQRWHQDIFVQGSGEAVRVVRTIIGAPTEYALDEQGSGRTSLKRGGITTHYLGPKGAWHRAPAPQLHRDRVVYAITLVPLQPIT